MMEYELINPSDPYTFIAEDFETAALVVLILGAAYGATPKGGGERVPIFIITEPGTDETWYVENFGRSPNEGLEAKRDLVADAMESMMLGKFKDRERYNVALGAIDDPKKRENFKKAWQEDCSSCNNIGKRAHTIAAQLRAQKK